MQCMQIEGGIAIVVKDLAKLCGIVRIRKQQAKKEEQNMRKT